MAIHISTSPNQLQFPVHSDLYQLKSLILVVWQHLKTSRHSFLVLYVLDTIHTFSFYIFALIWLDLKARKFTIIPYFTVFRIIHFFIHLWNFNNLSAISITILYFSVSITVAEQFMDFIQALLYTTKLLPSNLNASETKPKK